MKACIICSNERHKRLFKVNSEELVGCTNCGLVSTRGSLRVDYGAYHGDETYKDLEPLFRNIFKKRVKRILRIRSKKGRILDIGCSRGLMLELFKEEGWEVWGIEPSKSALEAKKRKIKVLRSTFEKAKLPTNYFDVVILNHTLEHMDNPFQVLKKVETLLKKGGIVYIDVPNFGSLSANLLGKNWPYILAKEHVYHFTKETLEKLLNKAGFKIRSVKTQSGLLECFSPLSEVFLSLFTFKKRFFPNVLGFPGAFFATMINRGSGLSIIGEKK